MPCNALFDLLMRCQEFAQIVAELARGQMMDAAQRAQGLAHTESCAICAARLQGERALSAGLNALAASESKLSAPASTEAALLAAFRQKTVSSISAPPLAATTRWPRWAWAAAAAILLALSFIALRARQDQTPPDNVAALPSPTSTTTPPTQQRVVPLFDQPVMQSDAPKSRAQSGTQQARYQRPVSKGKQRPQRLLIRDVMTVYAAESEVKSDFFPLTHGAQPPPLESGQLIRVQMPRAALAAYGLPVNLERADTPVKAELLVSEDGQAHAIRFVR